VQQRQRKHRKQAHQQQHRNARIALIYQVL
jgi:hypothetical protein